MGAHQPEQAERWKPASLRLELGAGASENVSDIHVFYDDVLLGSQFEIDMSGPEAVDEKHEFSPLIIFEETFDDRAFDGPVNQDFWRFNPDNPIESVQENGALRFTIPGTDDWLSIRLDSDLSWSVDEANYFETMMKIEQYGGWGTGAMYFSVGPGSGNYAIECDLQVEAAGLFCFVNSGSSETEYYVNMLDIDFKVWYNVIIVIDPDTFMISFYLDGVLIDSYIPENVERWRTAPLRVFLGAYGNRTTEPFNGYVDYVAVGNLQAHGDGLLPPEGSFQPHFRVTKLFAEGFEDETYEGSYNPDIWKFWRMSSLEGYQADGVFNFHIPEGETEGERLGTIESWTIEEINYVGARMRLDPYDAWGNAYIFVSLGQFEIPEMWEIGMVLTAAGEWACIVFSGSQEPEFISSGPAELDIWHYAEILIDPLTFEIEFYLDGNLLTTYIPDHAQRWISSPLHVGLSAGGEENTAPVSGYIDDVLAGKFDETLAPGKMPLSTTEKLLQNVAVADLITELSGEQPVEENITTILRDDTLWITSTYSLLNHKLWVMSSFLVSAYPLRPDFLVIEGWMDATLIEDAPVIGERSVVFESREGGFGDKQPVAVARFIDGNIGVELLFSGESGIYDVKDVVDLAFKIAEQLPDSPLPIEPIMVPFEVMDQEAHDRFLTSIRIGKPDQNHNQLLPMRTFVRDQDELCFEIDLASPPPPIMGAIQDEGSGVYIYKVTRLAPISLEKQLVCNYGIVTLPEGSYRYKVWMGKSLVAELPFEVQR